MRGGYVRGICEKCGAEYVGLGRRFCSRVCSGVAGLITLEARQEGRTLRSAARMLRAKMRAVESANKNLSDGTRD